MICRPIEAPCIRRRDRDASRVRRCGAAELPSAGEQPGTNHQHCADDQRQDVARSRKHDSRPSSRRWASNRHRPYDDASVIICRVEAQHRYRRGGQSPNQDGSGEDRSPRHRDNRTNRRWTTLRSGSDSSPRCGTVRHPGDGRSGQRAGIRVFLRVSRHRSERPAEQHPPAGRPRQILAEVTKK